jgi:hypothetical protein
MPVSDIRVYAGATDGWVSIKGTNGAPGPSAVSTNAGQLAKLGTDNLILVASTDLDARYVNVTGDTMTGQLIVQPAVGPAAPEGSIKIIGDNTNAGLTLERNADAAGRPGISFKRSRGTNAAPTGLQAGDNMGTILWSGCRPDGTFGTSAQIQASIAETPAAGVTNPVGQIIFFVGNGTGTTPVMYARSGDVFIPTLLVATISGDHNVTGTVIHTHNASGIAHAINPKPIAPLPDDVLTGVVVTIDRPELARRAENYIASNKGQGTEFNCCYLATADLPERVNNYAFISQSPAHNYFMGNLGLNFADPTYKLEVGGTTMLRGTLDVTGNITSSGTAHAFANGSIPSPAVIGNVPRTIAATGSAGIAGQMVWDENFLYLHTLSGWKKVALTAI